MRRVHAVLHAHSRWSYDGKWALADIARLYGRFGIDAVMMTEHDTGFDPSRFAEYRAACAAASTPRCTLIPGIEYSSPDNDIHILTWGLDEFLTEHRPVKDTLLDVRARQGVSILAHPVRRQAWQKFDPDWAPLLSGIELWNRKSDGINWGTEAWSLLQRTGLPATVGQDFHRMAQLYPLTQRFELGAEEPLEAGLISALREGRSIPEAFRQPILNREGHPRQWPHATLETMRRNLKTLRNGLRPRS